MERLLRLINSFPLLIDKRPLRGLPRFIQSVKEHRRSAASGYIRYMVFAIFMLAFGMHHQLEAQNTVTYVTDPNPISVSQGTSFDVIIAMQPSADPAPDIDAAAVHFDFDPTLLEVTNISTFEGANGLSNILVNQFDNVAGTIDFQAGVPTPPFGEPTVPVPGTGSIISISFNALAQGSTTLSYIFEGFRKTDVLRSGASLLTVPADIGIEIAGTPTVPEITLDATATVDEGGSISIPISILDADGDNLTVTFGSVSNEPQLLQTSNAGAQTDPFPTDAEGFYQVNVDAVNNGSAGLYEGNLVFTPQFGDGGGADGDGSGSYTITVTVDDGSSGPVTKDLALTVNDVPQFIAGTGLTRIEAESFDNQGPADAGTDNSGIGVEIFADYTNIGFTNVGDYAEYQINVETAGIYRFDFMVGLPDAAGATTGKEMTISSGSTELAVFSPTGTGNFATYEMQSINVPLPAGPQTLRFDWTAGSNFLFNIDYFDVEFVTETDVPPVIASIDPVIEVAEGGTINVPIAVTDDLNPSASIVIYDKSIVGAANNTDPFTSGGTVPNTEYSFTESPAGSGNWLLEWNTGTGDGRSYLARVTANDGFNPAVTTDFTINIAQPAVQTIAAKTFANPLPWYGALPVTPYTVAIEDNPNENIGYINNGDFVEYLIDVPAPGAYELRISAATNSGTEDVSSALVTFSEEAGSGFSSIGDVPIPNLSGSGWQDYSDYIIPVVFTNAGPQTFRLDFDAGVNVLEFEFSIPTTPFFTASLGDQANFEGDSPVGLSVAAEDPDGGAVTYSDGGSLPPGLTLDTNTGEISGAISAGAETSSPYSVVITATDDDVPAESATNTFLWYVSATSISTPICVNVGSQANVTAFGGRSFGDDDPYATNFVQNFNSATAISGTVAGSPEEALFQSEKYGDPLNFLFPTGNGAFTVELYFAEIFVGVQNTAGVGARVFDINVEGVTENGVDLFEEYGPATAATKTFAVTVSDGFLNIDLDATAENAKLSAICITPTAAFVPNAAPVVSIDPVSIVDCQGDGEDITLTATASDTEQGDLTSLIVWRDSEGTEVGTGGTLTLTGFTAPATYTAEVADATPSLVSESIVVDVTNAPPVLANFQASPAGSATGVAISLSATATDGQDDDASLVVSWSSDLDGALGDGSPLVVNTEAIPLTVGTHTITASVTDSCGATTTAQLTVEITTNNPPTFANYISPQDFETFRDCEGDGEEVTLQANFDDVEDDASGTPLSIEWFNGATSLGTGNPLTVPLDIGGYSLYAIATDSDGNSTTASASLTVDVLAEPSFVVTSETVGGVTLEGASISGPGELTVCWSTTDIDFGAGEHIHIRLDGTDNGQGNSNPVGGIDPYVRVDAASGCFKFTNVGVGPHVISLTGAETGHNEICDGQQVSFNVVDNTPPIAFCNDIEVQLGPDGTAVVDPVALSEGSSDNDGIASFELSKTNFTCADIGTQQVTLTLTDFSGNTATCTANLTIVDILAPVLTCSADIVTTSSNGSPVPISVPVPEISDNCEVTTLTATVSGGAFGTTGTTFPVDLSAATLQELIFEANTPYSILWTATDSYGNPGTCVQSVNVNFTPNALPVADAGDDFQFVIDLDNSGSEDYTLDGSGSFDSDGTIVSYVWKADGTQIATGVSPTVNLPQGQYLIELTVTDDGGASATDTFTLSVDGNEAPNIECPLPEDITFLEIVFEKDGNCMYTVPDLTSLVTVEDDTDPNPSLVQSPAPGTMLSGVGILTQEITMTSTDANGNSASCSFFVDVVDVTPPTITCPADETVVGNLAGEAILPDFTGLVSASDNCSPAVTVSQSPVAGTLVTGTTIVTMTATDAAGNSSTCSFEYTVEALQLVSLGDTVFEDLDADGIFDAGEPGVEGVTVFLEECGGSIIATTTTDANGFYLFDNLEPGDYRIIFSDLPEFYVFTAPNTGGDDAVDSDADNSGTTGCITLVSGEDNLTVDAGILDRRGSIGDLVFEDLNYNGVLDPGEPGIENVQVGLYTPTGLAVDFTFTNANGLYSFNSVEPGDYYIEFEIDSDQYIATNQNVGGDDSIDSDGNVGGVTSTFTLNPGENNFNVDMGLVDSRVSISGLVFEDLNRNGIRDTGEPGIPGIQVSIERGCGDLNRELYVVETTDANGNYSVSDLAPNYDYRVVFADFGGLPEGYIFTTSNVGADDTIDSDADENGFTPCLQPDPLTDITSVDAGISNLNGSIGDFVFEDLNQNGVQDAGEPGIPNVEVSLIKIETGGRGVFAITQTDANGFYSFNSIMPGDYQVSFFEEPAGRDLKPTAQNVGGDDSLDSDGDANGFTQDFKLNPGESITSIDMGYVEAVQPLDVVEFVLVDADADVDLFTITEGMLIDVTGLPTANLNIRAEVGPNTESVALQLTGPQTQTQTENFAPYALFGDNSGNYNANNFPLGSYSLSGTAYSADGADGTSGTSASVNFTFTDENPACLAFDASLNDSIDPSSCGSADGSISIGISGGEAPFTYAWSHDASLNSDTATGLTEGSYTVTVTDANGCIDIVSTSLSDPAGPSVSLAPFSTALDTDAPLTLTGGSPAGGEYSGPGVSGGQFDPSIGPGTYTITYTYTDGNGCSGSASQNIVVTTELDDAALIVLDATTDTELFALTDGLVIYKSEVGDTPLGVIYNSSLDPGGVQFNLSGPLTQGRFEGPEPHSLFGDIGVDIVGEVFPVGSYTLIADPVNGPTITVNFTVADLDPACIGFDAGIASSTDSGSCSDPDGSITVETTGGTAPFSYQWSHDGSLNSATASGLSAGTYTVAVTDANGCSDVASASIEEPLGPLVTLAPFGEILESDPVFELTGGSPAGGEYSGPGVSGGFFNPSVGPGIYTITYTVTDANGCTGATTQDLVVTSELGDAALIVLDATTDTELYALTDGLVIYKDDIGETPLGVIYDADLNPGGVFFTLTGPITESRFEGPVPHSLFGDIGVDIQGKPFPIGEYTLVANASNGSAPDFTINFSVVAGSAPAKGAIATKSVIPMTASPNPADDEVHIAFELPTKIETFRIFDTAGKLVKTIQAMPGTDLRTYDLTVLDLPIGMYYVRAIDDQGNSYQEQILVSRF